jgi:hypothetical protein
LKLQHLTVRAKPPAPEQRRVIDARLAKADADIKAGRVSKAFSDHGEFIADLHKAVTKLSTKKVKRPRK